MMNHTMLTDLYQLTMMAAYAESGNDAEEATFDLFIRKLPDNWGYFVAAGIEDAIDYITSLKFEEDDIEYLRKQDKFSEAFLDYLRNFHFCGDVYAVKDGTPVFPNEPLLRVTAKRAEAQFVETALLNIINFQTMVASKASRVVNAAAPAAVVDFGLRRAQGADAGMKGARAAYIAGAVATSNVLAGKEYGIPITGTHAHSFVMSFPDELDAFRAYVKAFPDSPTLLIDTYDTVQGAKNAAIVGKELEARGKKLGAVRLDSGDLAALSRHVRQILDNAGLPYVRIVASNDLNEYKIRELVANGARIDGYGVGTEMITAKPTAAIAGVYKLVEDEAGAKIKLSEGKKTCPGKKQLFRLADNDGNYLHDVLALEEEEVEGTPLLEQVVARGQRVMPNCSLEEVRRYSLDCVARLPAGLRQTCVEGHYDVVLSHRLKELVWKLTNKYAADAAKTNAVVSV